MSFVVARWLLALALVLFGSQIYAQVCYETRVYYEKVPTSCGSTDVVSGSALGVNFMRNTVAASCPADCIVSKPYLSFVPTQWIRTDILPPRFVLPTELVDVGLTDYFTNDKILSELWRRKKIGSLIDKTVQYQPPQRVQYTAGEDRSDLNFWRYKLDPQDHNRYMYIIIPTAGIVAPISQMPQNDDFRKIILGKKISVRNYLYNGVLHYPHSEYAGEHGNFIVAGHSSEYKSAPGRYKTAFTTLPLVDKGNSVYVYVREQSGKYKKFEYITTKSYNTSSKNVGVLKFKDGKNITLITCTPIGGLAGRWIVEGVLVPE